MQLKGHISYQNISEKDVTDYISFNGEQLDVKELKKQIAQKLGLSKKPNEQKSQQDLVIKDYQSMEELGDNVKVRTNSKVWIERKLKQNDFYSSNQSQYNQNRVTICSLCKFRQSVLQTPCCYLYLCPVCDAKRKNANGSCGNCIQQRMFITSSRQIQFQNPSKPPQQLSEMVLPGKDQLELLCQNAKFFVVKSCNEENVKLAKEYSKWATTLMNQKRLNEAFGNSQNVILLFAINRIKQFVGCARMEGLPQTSYDIYWKSIETIRLGGNFSIRWLRTSMIEYHNLQNITNPLNGNEQVSQSRDCQEIGQLEGRMICQKFEAPIIQEQQILNIENEFQNQTLIQQINDQHPSQLNQKQQQQLSAGTQDIVKDQENQNQFLLNNNNNNKLQSTGQGGDQNGAQQQQQQYSKENEIVLKNLSSKKKSIDSLLDDLEDIDYDEIVADFQQKDYDFQNQEQENQEIQVVNQSSPIKENSQNQGDCNEQQQQYQEQQQDVESSQQYSRQNDQNLVQDQQQIQNEELPQLEAQVEKYKEVENAQICNDKSKSSENQNNKLNLNEESQNLEQKKNQNIAVQQQQTQVLINPTQLPSFLPGVNPNPTSMLGFGNPMLGYGGFNGFGMMNPLALQMQYLPYMMILNQQIMNQENLKNGGNKEKKHKKRNKSGSVSSSHHNKKKKKHKQISTSRSPSSQDRDARQRKQKKSHHRSRSRHNRQSSSSQLKQKEKKKKQ